MDEPAPVNQRPLKRPYRVFFSNLHLIVFLCLLYVLSNVLSVKDISEKFGIGQHWSITLLGFLIFTVSFYLYLCYHTLHISFPFLL